MASATLIKRPPHCEDNADNPDDKGSDLVGLSESPAKDDVSNDSDESNKCADVL
ncbi:hypothetical protein [Halorubrum sp. FL23]|uniref:hypothetical protein n=1 Tax=Halorubrum sp. FL23 TaxID=3458704 RepID=UPI0040346D5A